MGDIIAIFEERGFKLAALKFMQATEDMLKEHYGDLANKPFFPELVRYLIFFYTIGTFKFCEAAAPTPACRTDLEPF